GRNRLGLVLQRIFGLLRRLRGVVKICILRDENGKDSGQHECERNHDCFHDAKFLTRAVALCMAKVAITCPTHSQMKCIPRGCKLSFDSMPAGTLRSARTGVRWK